ncbi:hypothetical protein B0189_06665 [Moraxella cuniculi]|nr:hypothetical protein B0189_06665 [Moraxella cuniculi]
MDNFWQLLHDDIYQTSQISISLVIFGTFIKSLTPTGFNIVTTLGKIAKHNPPNLKAKNRPCCP